MKSLGIADDTKEDFDRLKATKAETMSADEFLRVLLTVYKTAVLEVERKRS